MCREAASRVSQRTSALTSRPSCSSSSVTDSRRSSSVGATTRFDRLRHAVSFHALPPSLRRRVRSRPGVRPIAPTVCRVSSVAVRADRRRDRAIAIFASLGADERERVCRAAADISLVPGEYAAAPESERALFAVLEGRIEAVMIDRRDRAHRRRAQPGRRSSARCRSRSARSSRSGSARPSRRACCGLEPPDYHADRVGRAGGRRSRSAGSPPTGSAEQAGLQGLAADAAAAARDPGRAPLGRVLHRAAPLPRSQPDHVQVGRRRTRRTRSSSGAGRCRPSRTGRRSGSSTARPSVAPDVPPRRRAARPHDRAGRAPSTTR